MAVIYLRVSTEEQGKSGLGLGAQLKDCQDYCRRADLNVLGVFQDIVSGKVHPKKRPAFTEVIKIAHEHDCPIIVSTQDRFTRSMLHLCSYIEREMYGRHTPKLIFADNPNCSDLEMHCRAMVSQEERRLIGKRTKDALAKLKVEKPNIKLGDAGQKAYRAKVDAKINDAMRVAMVLRGDGKSYQYIADNLNENELFNYAGGKWTAEGVYRRLKVRLNSESRVASNK